MALLRMATMIQQKLFISVKPFVSSLCFPRKYPFFLQRTICSRHGFYGDSNTDEPNLAHRLICIFSRQPFSQEDPDLQKLAPRLNTKVVETVLKNFRRWGLAYVFFNWASNQVGYRNDIYTYNAMASILLRARQNARLRALVADVVNSGCPMSPGALGFLIRCLGGAGLVEEATMLFDHVKSTGICVPNVYSYNCLLEAISKSQSGSIELMDVRLKEMRESGYQFDKYTLTPVLKMSCNLGKFDKALEIYNVIHGRGWVDEHILSILAVSFSKWGEVDRACDLVERMEEHNTRLNYKTFCVLIHGFVRQSRVDKAHLIFEKMRLSGFLPDIGLYDAMIGEYCKKKELEKALSLYSEMKHLRMQPDCGVIGKLLSSFSKESDLIRVVEEVHEDLDAKSLKLLYRSVLEGFMKNDSAKKAYSFLQAITSNVSNDFPLIDKLINAQVRLILPDVNSFAAVINGLLDTNALGTALSLLHQVGRIGYKLDVKVYNGVIERLCKAGRVEECCEILQAMKEVGAEPDQFTLNSVFGGFCGRGDVHGALYMVRKMRLYGFEPWLKNSTLLVKNLCKNGKAIESCKFLEDLVEEGFLAHIVPYTAAIDGLIKIKEIGKAVELFEKICARGYCPDVIAYNVLIKGICKVDRLMEAKELFDEMLMKGLTPSVVTYNALMDGWCSNGKVENAMSFFVEMNENDIEPDVVTYTILVNGFCAAGQPNDAIALWNEMKKKGQSPGMKTYMALIQGLCSCSRPHLAQVYFDEMKDNDMEPDASVYATLISAFLSISQMENAFEVFKQMIDRIGFPDSADTNSSIIKDALSKFLEDARTCSTIRTLIAEGQVPAVDKAVKSEPKAAE